MKTLFTAEAISEGQRSETNQTPNELQIVPLGGLRGGKPPIADSGWLSQSSQKPVRGHDEGALMNSQLG